MLCTVMATHGLHAGEHAVALDEASDKQVVDGVQSLYSCFPAIPKPQGGKPQVSMRLFWQCSQAWCSAVQCSAVQCRLCLLLAFDCNC